MTLSVTMESSLDKCIQTFLHEDIIDSSEEYKCDKCSQISKVKIRTELSKLPDVLAFHLKRFTYPTMRKITGQCKYPLELDMSQ